jgi:raffinose/stachyose/melibiose transport system substrate-binding protein
MKHRRIIVLTLTVALLVTMFVFPTTSAMAEQEKLTLIYWGGGASSVDPIDQCFQRTVDEFNALGGVQVDLQYVAGDTYYTKLPAMVAANTAPDMFCIHASGKIKQYVDAEKVLPLNDYIDADPAWRDSFAGGAFGLLTFNDKIYGVPWYSSAVPLFYNKEIFDKYKLTPPADYEQLKEVIKVLKENGVTPFAFGAKDAWTCALFMEIVANRIGGDKPYDDIMGGGGSWLDPSFIKAGQIMQELVTLGAFPEDYLGLGADNMNAMFGRAKRRCT